MRFKHGDIRVIEINTTNAVAGRMFICDDGKWRAVCDDGWNRNDARVVCHQLVFDPQGTAIMLQAHSLHYIPLPRSCCVQKFLLWQNWQD